MDFDHIYRTHFHEVRRWIRYLGGLPSDLDDLTQEIFQVVLNRLERFDGRDAKGWLYAITHRTLLAYRRKSLLSRLFYGADELPAFVAPVTPSHDALLCRNQVDRALRKMSVKLRTALLLHEIEGYTAEEIAGLEGVPTSTVHSRLRLARARFVELAREQGGEDAA